MRPADRRRPFAVAPQVKAALALLLHGEHFGRERGATWERLREELAAVGIQVNAVRRLQEAVSDLRRVEKATIGATSRHGVFWIADDTDRRLAAAERVRRIRSEAAELEALDRALYEQIAGVLPIGDAA